MWKSPFHNIPAPHTLECIENRGKRIQSRLMLLLRELRQAMHVLCSVELVRIGCNGFWPQQAVGITGLVGIHAVFHCWCAGICTEGCATRARTRDKGHAMLRSVPIPRVSAACRRPCTKRVHNNCECAALRGEAGRGKVVGRAQWRCTGG